MSDYTKCDAGCDYEGHCLTIQRFDGLVLVCPECFWDYIPDYHQDALLKVASRKLYILECKQGYLEEEERRDDESNTTS